jgi:PAS domain S-box-containing protein
MSEHHFHAQTDSDAEHRLQALLANHSHGLLEVAADRSVTLASRTLGNWLGVEPARLVGETLASLVASEDRVSLERQLDRLLEGTIDATAVTHRLMVAHGSHMWVRSSWSARRGRDGSISHLIALVECVRQQREDELVRSILEESIRGLEERRRFFDRMLGDLPTIAWRALPNGVCEYLSPQWSATTGMRDGRGLRWLAAIEPDDRRLLAAAWSAPSPTTDEPRRMHCRIRHADGSYHGYEIVAAPVRDAERMLVAWTGVFVPAALPRLARSRGAVGASQPSSDLSLRVLTNRPPETPNGTGYLPA